MARRNDERSEENGESQILAEAKARFGVSDRYFNIAWTNAIDETSQIAWSNSGPVRNSKR
jgi:hypothetical protein